jgi:signal peptidase II
MEGLAGTVSRPRGRRHLEMWIPLVVVALDQATKAIVRARLPLHESVPVIPGLVDFTHVRNTGAAFGLFDVVQFPYKTLVIAAVALVGLIGVAFYAASLARQQVLSRLALALIIGGAAGNLIDRIGDGSVVDFVDVYWRTYHFWAFNVADSAITIGVAIMLLDAIGAGRNVSKAA